MEGIPTAPRKPRNVGPRPVKVPKLEKDSVSKERGDEVKGTETEGGEKLASKVKAEPVEMVTTNLPQGRSIVSSETATKLLPDPREGQAYQLNSQLLQGAVIGPPNSWTPPGGTAPGRSNEVVVKVEPGWDD